MLVPGFVPPILPAPLLPPRPWRPVADPWNGIPNNLSDPWWPWPTVPLPSIPIPWPFPNPFAPKPTPGLDPGLNGPEPAPTPAPLVTPPDGQFGPDPFNPEQQFIWSVTYSRTQIQYRTVDCGSGDVTEEIRIQVPPKTIRITAEAVRYKINNAYVISQGCNADPPGWNLIEPKPEMFVLEYLNKGVWYPLPVDSRDANQGTLNGFYEPGRVVDTWVNIPEVLRDDIPEKLPDLVPLFDPETKPRPEPIPIEPLPEPEPEPAGPEPEEEPEPLVAPEPDDPDREPVIIPRPAPAEPQPVPTEPAPVPLPLPLPVIPGTQPNPAPDPFPGTDPVPQPQPVPAPGPQPGPQPLPGVVPLPAPLPGVPPIRQPDPDPQPEPAPAPNPLPNPEPGPNPDPQPFPETDPLPGESPLPSPLPLPGPIPAPIPLPGITPAPRPIDPVSGPVPLPGQYPNPTPPGHHFPVTGGPAVTPGGTRPDIGAIAAEVGRIEQKTANIQRPGGLPDLGDLLPLLNALNDLLEGDLPGTTYKLTGVCEDPVGEGQQPNFTISIPPAKNFTAITERLDVIDSLLQQHLAWKTPICSDKERPTLEGDFRTIHFVSDEKTDDGGTRLRKRFRYRSTSGESLGSIVNHWRDFVWQAGPVCVKHVESSWGTLTVWAASADEGKRVVRHAAGEAGIDPDQNGRWIVGGSNSPRLGLPGTMRVSTRGGVYRITARDGSDGPPMVAVKPYDL